MSFFGGLTGLVQAAIPVANTALQYEVQRDIARTNARIAAEQRAAQNRLAIDANGNRRFELMLLGGLALAGIVVFGRLKGG